MSKLRSRFNKKNLGWVSYKIRIAAGIRIYRGNTGSGKSELENGQGKIFKRGPVFNCRLTIFNL